jgi:hypothetical protein
MKTVVDMSTNVNKPPFATRELQQILAALLGQLQLQVVYTNEGTYLGNYEYKVEKMTLK